MKKHHGFTLLEVLISLFLLSLLLLGVTAAQVAALREARATFYFQQARMLAENMSEYFVVHGGDVSRYEQSWREQIYQALPEASGTVSGSYPDYRVVIQWGGMKSCNKNLIGDAGCCVIDRKM